MLWAAEIPLLSLTNAKLGTTQHTSQAKSLHQHKHSTTSHSDHSFIFPTSTPPAVEVVKVHNPSTNLQKGYLNGPSQVSPRPVPPPTPKEHQNTRFDH
jgi:hypothetical protein